MDQQTVMKTDEQYYMKVFARYPIVLSYGEGPYVYDSNGKKYIDFLGGIAVNVLGHAHPKLVAAITRQAGRLIHCSNLYYTEEQASLAAKLAEASGMDRVFFGNSGAEANEGAIKLARKYGKTVSPVKVEIISAYESFHGRTLAALTATGQPKYHKGYEPLPGGFKHVQYNNLEELKNLMSPERTCAVLLEPIQGEGGINMPAPGYLEAVRDLCDQTGALLIFDEIQTGMGRTGRMFAYQTFGIRPDIATVAKGLGGGVPIGAFMTTDKIAAAFAPGDHGTTFGGNPLACAAGNAVLDSIAEENLLANAAAMGEYLDEQLTKLKSKYPQWITEVRGKGLMIGAKLTKPGRDIVNQCLEQGVIINCTAGDVLRFVPPLNINNGHIDEVMAVLDSVLAAQ
ncbi:Acetylornithine aminotransferase [Propionispora sp. 2/2-37]|uniref:acetylornithine transaminase n=1 Tax=Propionispora sp. 2/2-37 TaxID=1677858 RepID=UPI0006BB800B|nr:acetylornithine transaminase [Propionispora sp. 2/2-37]CUH95195.1 Acetylornithine aminotransferase [Propionispora sp. 2/2-37]